MRRGGTLCLFATCGLTNAQRLHPIDAVKREFAAATLNEKVNTHEAVYRHMLHLRTLQAPRSRIGHIGWFPIQTFKYYWLARQLAIDRSLARERPPTTCEVGFGDVGMSSAILLTATSSPNNQGEGGVHHVFDCSTCGTPDHVRLAESKRRAKEYLYRAFGARLHVHEGLSHQLLPAVAHERPDLECDLFIIDGDHSYLGVSQDIRAFANSTTLWTPQTIVLLDDINDDQVERAFKESVNRGLLQLRQRFNGDYHVDQIFSSQWGEGDRYPQTWTKNFVEARLGSTAMSLRRKSGWTGKSTRNERARARQGPGVRSNSRDQLRVQTTSSSNPAYRHNRGEWAHSSRAPGRPWTQHRTAGKPSA